MGIFWGFIAALSWGSGDFFARGISVRLTAYRALFYIHLVSTFVLLVPILIEGIPDTVTTGAVALAALLGAMNSLGTVLLYRALSIGKISIVSPVTSSFGGIALLLSLLAGDVISTGGVFSLILMLVGVIIVSIVRDEPQQDTQRTAVRGLPEAIFAALALGLNFWGLQFVVEPLGPYVTTLVGRIVTLALLSLLAKPLRQTVALPSRENWTTIAICGVITTFGEIAYNTGVQGTTPGIVAVLGSLFSPVTVLLALVFLRERLARHQWVGVGIIFIATMLIGLFQNFGAQPPV